jgi:hypothetical protein
MRPGDQGLIRTAELVRFELFDLDSDPGERRDVSVEHPHVKSELLIDLLALHRTVQQVDAGWTESWLRRW